jgi:hypothetical protein
LYAAIGLAQTKTPPDFAIGIFFEEPAGFALIVLQFFGIGVAITGAIRIIQTDPLPNCHRSQASLKRYLDRVPDRRVDNCSRMARLLVRRGGRGRP